MGVRLIDDVAFRKKWFSISIEDPKNRQWIGDF